MLSSAIWKQPEQEVMTLLHSHKSSIGFRIALLALATLVMMPVLLRPHWGMFSDPVQILDTCHTAFSHKTTLSKFVHLVCGDFRPVFHLTNFAVWAIWPHSPLPYFLLKWVCFALTVDLTFQNAFLLSDSRKSAFISTTIWFLAYPTYEVIYTLDKGEIYVGMLFAIVIAAHQQFVRLKQQEVFTGHHLLLGTIILISCLTLAFTKLPGNLVLIYSGLPLVVILLRSHRASEREFSLKTLLREPTHKWQLYFFGTCILASVSFVCFYIAGEGYKHPYGETSLSPPFLWSQLISYIAGVPEFFACTLLTAGSFVISRKHLDGNVDWQRFEAVMLLLTSIAGALALLTWKSQIAYSYYPLYSFLLPGFAYALKLVESRFRILPQIISTIYVALLLPARFVDAQEQYQMDSLFFNLSKTTASKSMPFVNSMIFPMNHQAAAELGEELEYMSSYFAGKQPPSYDDILRGTVAQQFAIPARVSSLILNSSGDSRKDLHQLPEAFFFAKTFVETPGYYKLTYLRNQDPRWLVENVLHGDILLIPYGDIRLSKIPYRGLSLFTMPESAKLQSYQSLELKPIFRVEKSIHDLFGHVQKIGWLGAQVMQERKYSLRLLDYGWLENPAHVYFDQSLRNRVLSLQTDLSCVSELSMSSQGKSLTIKASPVRSGVFKFEIPLLSSGQRLESTNGTQKGPVLMKVKSISISEQPKPL